MSDKNPLLSQIPRGHLEDMLKESVWFSGGREEFGDTQGYSCEVREETALRDVVYRSKPLYPTADEAIVAYWKKFYELPGELISKPGAVIEVRKHPLTPPSPSA